LDEDEIEWPDYCRIDYKECSFKERFLWVRRKNGVVDLLEGLARVETRRLLKRLARCYLSGGSKGYNVWGGYHAC
jgi:hypothetical protein